MLGWKDIFIKAVFTTFEKIFCHVFGIHEKSQWDLCFRE